jgi:uncharacterized protein (DUF4415 family)
MDDLHRILAISCESRGLRDSEEGGMTHQRKRNVSQEIAYVELMIELDAMERRLQDSRLKDRLIPPDWHRIEHDVPVRPKKEKLSVAFDADLVKWFRNMGHGYQARMNAVLRTFMKAVVSKEILTHGDRDRNGDQIWGLPDRGK